MWLIIIKKNFDRMQRGWLMSMSEVLNWGIIVVTCTKKDSRYSTLNLTLLISVFLFRNSNKDFLDRIYKRHIS